MPVVTLVSSDGNSFHVDSRIAMMSQTVRGIIEVCDFEEKEESKNDLSIPLSNVTSETLKKVIDWCEQHKPDALIEDEMVEREKKRRICSEEWNRAFLEIETSVLFDLIIAANYLDIKELLILCCKAVAIMFNGKSPDDIRETFGIINDLTTEEQLVIDNEIAWINAVRLYSTCTSSLKEVFPLMNLPNEILSMILQQMHPVNRLRARICKRLYLLESIGRYHIGELVIVRGLRYPFDLPNSEKLVIGISDSVETSSYIAVLQKIATNSTVDSLIFMETLLASNFEFADLMRHLKSIRARSLVIKGDCGRAKLDDINDDTLDEWTRDKECLRFPEAYGHGNFALGTEITGVGLYQLFESMSTSSTSLRRFNVHVFGQAGRTMVRRLGITTAAGSFFSTRRDVRVHFSDGMHRQCTSRKYFFIIGENMLITYHLASLYAPGRRHQLQCEPCDLSMERQNEDGSLPDDDYFTGALSIRHIIETFPPAPLVFS